MYQIFTFNYTGHPMPFENKKFNSRENAEARMNELKGSYTVPMMVKEVK